MHLEVGSHHGGLGWEGGDHHELFMNTSLALRSRSSDPSRTAPLLHHRAQGEVGLESLPPISKSQPTRLDPQLERLILRLRDSSGFAPKRLHYWLRRNLKGGVAKSFDWKSLPNPSPRRRNGSTGV